MTLTKSLLFFAIFSNINCIWQRGTGLAPAFQDRRLLVMIRQQNPVVNTEMSKKDEYEEKNEDHRIRLLRKRTEAAEATMGRIRIL